jgi:L-ascorbate metabolism protein UlaG (beta-lactamase superfamily)
MKRGLCSLWFALLLSLGVSLEVAATDVVATLEGPVRLTPIRHASLMIEFKGRVIHVDPWSQGSYEGLPKADLILITDTHPDHLDLTKIMELTQASTRVVAPAAAANSLSDAIVLSNGETKVVQGIQIEAVPMYNFQRGPSAGKFYHDKGRGNGYILTLGGKRIYISGDTECIPEMKNLKSIDVAFLCMNLPYTMPTEEAAECVKAFRPKVLYPYHYGQSDLKPLIETLKNEKGIEVRIRNWY